MEFRKLSKVLSLVAVALVCKVGLTSYSAFAIEEGKFSFSGSDDESKSNDCHAAINVTSKKDDVISVDQIADFKNINGDPVVTKTADKRTKTTTTTLTADVLKQVITYSRTRGGFTAVPQEVVYEVTFAGGGQVKTKVSETFTEEDKNRSNKTDFEHNCDYKKN